MRHIWCFHMFFRCWAVERGVSSPMTAKFQGVAQPPIFRDLPYQQSMVNFGWVKPTLKTSWRMVGMIYCPRGYNSTLYIYPNDSPIVNPMKSWHLRCIPTNISAITATTFHIYRMQELSAGEQRKNLSQKGKKSFHSYLFRFVWK